MLERKTGRELGREGKRARESERKLYIKLNGGRDVGKEGDGRER